jgi:type IV pili sensor histidine kinase/response regulator
MNLNLRFSRRALFFIGLATLISNISLVAEAGSPPSESAPPIQKVARYSVIQPSPTPGQQDLLAVSAPLHIPNDINTVGGALEWVIEGSGLRLADPNRLSPDVKHMLNLPLPNAHRQFQALPLKDVLALLAGPAFVLVHDPVHRLLAFERCRDNTQRQALNKATQRRDKSRYASRYTNTGDR